MFCRSRLLRAFRMDGLQIFGTLEHIANNEDAIKTFCCDKYLGPANTYQKRYVVAAAVRRETIGRGWNNYYTVTHIGCCQMTEFNEVLQRETICWRRCIIYEIRDIPSTLFVLNLNRSLYEAFCEESTFLKEVVDNLFNSTEHIRIAIGYEETEIDYVDDPLPYELVQTLHPRSEQEGLFALSK